jgi:hypothetical protein
VAVCKEQRKVPQKVATFVALQAAFAQLPCCSFQLRAERLVAVAGSQQEADRSSVVVVEGIRRVVAGCFGTEGRRN